MKIATEVDLWEIVMIVKLVKIVGLVILYCSVVVNVVTKLLSQE